MVRRQKISDSQIALLYRAGEARDLIGMKAGIPDYAIVEVLRRNGEPLRNDAEARAISIKNRERWKSTQAARLKRRRAG